MGFLSLQALNSAQNGNGDIIKRALQSVRGHLGMDAAYVSEFVDDRVVFREVDAPGLEDLVREGDSVPLEYTYCGHILAGRLPALIADTGAHPFARTLAATKDTPVGAHVSVPIRLPDGRVYGMFCCFSLKPCPSLNERDLKMVRAFADLASHQIDVHLQAEQATEEKRARIWSAIRNDELSMVYQPIWDFRQSDPIGFECLSRFSAAPYRAPNIWFAEAEVVGLGSQLEVAALRRAFAGAAGALPERAYLSVNASPKTILTPGFVHALMRVPLQRLVLEITEHEQVPDYSPLLDVLQPLRSAGLRLAVDDAGAGYASFQHIVRLKPDIIKLDRELTRDVDSDPARRALAAALVFFSRETSSMVIAEGVETTAELETLQALGIARAQGYLLGRPMPVEAAARLFADTADRKAG